MNKYKIEIDNLSKWLRSTVTDARGKGVVFGLSGGIDSAVVGAISKLAFPDTSLGIIMPCHSQDQDALDALEVADAIDLKTETVDLTDTYDTFIRDTDIVGTELSKQNIKPRLRAMTQYYYGQTLGYLSLGGTNLSEYFIGYFTKNGDTGVDILPIADYTKKEVYIMAEILGIPDRIIKKKPSAGLVDGQTDEKDLGFTYDYLDSKIETGDWDRENTLDQKILKMHRNSEHKRKNTIIYRREENGRTF